MTFFQFTHVVTELHIYNTILIFHPSQSGRVLIPHTLHPYPLLLHPQPLRVPFLLPRLLVTMFLHCRLDVHHNKTTLHQFLRVPTAQAPTTIQIRIVLSSRLQPIASIAELPFQRRRFIRKMMRVIPALPLHSSFPPSRNLLKVQWIVLN